MTKRKILVVDDDRKIVELVRLYLEKDGYRVLVAYDGQQALQIARQRRPELILLDLMLPGMDGLDVCRALRREGLGGVLVKARKPGQENRVDLPTIGPETVEKASLAGLRGIAIEASGALVVDEERLVSAADARKLFVLGFPVDS